MIRPEPRSGDMQDDEIGLPAARMAGPPWSEAERRSGCVALPHNYGIAPKLSEVLCAPSDKAQLASLCQIEPVSLFSSPR